MPHALLFAWLACQTPEEAGFGPAPARPEVAHRNVLLITLDDVGTDAIGAYAEHPAPARTPALDQLAAQGTRFTHAYAYPVCSPTRAALLTGRHGRRTGAVHNYREGRGQALPRSERGVAQLLASAEPPYTSALVGKWHLQDREILGVDHPRAFGFDHVEGALGNLRLEESYDRYLWTLPDGTIEESTAYLTTREVNTALALMADLPEPWFIWLSLHAPHAPWSPPPGELLSGSPPIPSAPVPLLYRAMLEAADTEIGRLLEAVDRDRTVVMVVGDNGGPDEAVLPPTSPDAVKNTVYEGGVRVPWIIAGSGVPEGVAQPALVHVVDLFPTLAALAGRDPERPGVTLDGEDLWPLIFGEVDAVRQVVFSERQPLGAEGPATTMVADGDFKRITTEGVEEALHDLRGRPDDGPNLLEMGPLSPEAAEARVRLNRALWVLEAGFAN